MPALSVGDRRYLLGIWERIRRGILIVIFLSRIGCANSLMIKMKPTYAVF